MSRTKAITERRAKTADHDVEPNTCFDQMATRGDHPAHAMRCWGFDVHRLIRPRPRQFREPGDIVQVGLVRLHRLQALVRLAGILVYDQHAEFA